MLFYALFGLLIVNRRVGLLVMIAWFGLCAAAATGTLPLTSIPYHVAPINLLFGIGMAIVFVARAKVSLILSLLCAIGGTVMFLAVGIAELAGNLSSGQKVALYGLAAGITIYGLVTAEQSRAMPVPSLVMLLGDASYSIYLTHYPALSVLARMWMKAGLGDLPSAVSFVGMLALVLTAGVIFRLLVERRVVETLQAQWRHHASIHA